MKILITNDDGIDSKLLQMLKEKLKEEKHEVWVVAPKTNQSAVGTKFNLYKKMEYKKINDKEYYIDGTPTDCINFAHSTIKEDFDFVISGINDAENIGYSVLDSGTVSGARRARIMGYKSIAISVDIDAKKENYSKYVDLTLKLLEEVDFNELGEKEFYNLNIPIMNDFNKYILINTKTGDFKHNNFMEISGNKCFYSHENDTTYSNEKENDDVYNYQKGKITLSKVKII